MAENYYNILGISNNASEEEIKKAYRREGKKWHPDLYINSDEKTRRLAEENMKKLNVAYEQIMKERKHNYNTNNFSNSNSSEEYYSSRSEQFDPFYEFAKQYTYYKSKKNQTINLENLDTNDLFIGDVCVYRYKLKYDYFASFEDQTTLMTLYKNAILLRVGFNEYINLSSLTTILLIKLFKGEISVDKLKIKGDFYKPYAGDIFVKNPKKLDNVYGQYTSIKKIKKVRCSY